MSFQPTGDTWTTHTRTAASGPRAGFFQRLGADIIDGIILFIATAILDGILHIVGEIFAFLLAFAYFSYLEGGPSGQTLGKRAMRIRVISLQDGQPIGYQRALVRAVFRIVSEIPLFLGYLWMLWSPEKQTWHDMIASAVVVPVDLEPRRPRTPW